MAQLNAIAFVVLVLVILSLFLGYLLLPSRWSNATKESDTSVAVVVVGDIGHSPRMQYHTASLAAHGVEVDLVGYAESDILRELQGHHLVHLAPLERVPSTLRRPSRALFPILAPLKALFQAWTLFYTLCYATKPRKFMLVQNPPAIPTLLIAVIVCRLRNTRLVIDWHNLGHTILALKLGKSHALVKVAAAYERLTAQMATSHIAVSEAMCRLLKRQYRVEATAVHDRPAKHFQPLSAVERAKVILRLPQTSAQSHEVQSGATRIVVSSTSWTPDEDFGVFLDALEAYSATVEMDPQLPGLLVVITGKGPQKAMYQDRIRQLHKDRKLVNVHIHTTWLSIEDYAALLGTADLGVSLHCSTSGVDLPMKVVDMFGCGLPVVGYDGFEAWSELVTEGISGRGFKNAEELEKLFEELFGQPGELERLRSGALKESERHWEDEWPRAARIFGLA